MDMRFFWVVDQTKMGNFDIQWHPGKENMADYFTKHFDSKHHQEVRPWYLHMPQSPRQLPRAQAPSTLRGCVGTLTNGYVKSVPLPRIAVPNRVPLNRAQGITELRPRTRQPAIRSSTNNCWSQSSARHSGYFRHCSHHHNYL